MVAIEHKILWQEVLRKSAAYVSVARKIIQPKFIDDFFCKALVAVNKNSSKHEFCNRKRHHNILVRKGRAITDPDLPILISMAAIPS